MVAKNIKPEPTKTTRAGRKAIQRQIAQSALGELFRLQRSENLPMSSFAFEFETDNKLFRKGTIRIHHDEQPFNRHWSFEFVRTAKLIRARFCGGGFGTVAIPKAAIRL
jgi:hypothetical protein